MEWDGMGWDVSESRWNFPLLNNRRDISRPLELVGLEVHDHASMIKELITMAKD
jgi:hypothetical protein